MASIGGSNIKGTTKEVVFTHALTFVYRAFDIPSKLFLYALVWYSGRGVLTFGAVVANAGVGVASWLRCKSDGKGNAPTDALLLVVATPLLFGGNRMAIPFGVWVFSVLETITMTTLLWNGSVDADVMGLANYATAGGVLKSLGTCCFGTLILNVEGLRRFTKEKSDIRSLLGNGCYFDVVELLLFAAGNVEDATKEVIVVADYTQWNFANIVFHVDNAKLMDAVWSTMDGTERVKALANLPAMDGMNRNGIFVSFLKTKWDDIDDGEWDNFAEFAKESAMKRWSDVDAWTFVAPRDVDDYFKMTRNPHAYFGNAQES